MLIREFLEIGKVKLKVTLLMKIKIIPYKVWQIPNFLVPRALKGKVTKMLKKRL